MSNIFYNGQFIGRPTFRFVIFGVLTSIEPETFYKNIANPEIWDN